MARNPADFITKLPEEAMELFVQVLLVCDNMNLIGKEMFALDGCKQSSNASKEWSGTWEDFEKKRLKLRKKIEELAVKHRQMDDGKGLLHIHTRVANPGNL